MLFRSIRDPGSSRRHKVDLSWYRNLANSRLAKEKQIADHTLASTSINFTESPFICRTWSNKFTAGAVFTATTLAVTRCQSDRCQSASISMTSWSLASICFGTLCSRLHICFYRRKRFSMQRKWAKPLSILKTDIARQMIFVHHVFAKPLV